MAYEIFGAIRIGSIEQELCIYEISPSKGIRLLDRVAAMLPLGNDTVSRGRLSCERVDELCRLLNDFAAVMRSYKADASKAYATMALRDAANAPIVIDQIRVRTGLAVNIISNSEQRYINYKALALEDRSFDEIIRTGTMIVDAGYGSVQLSLFDKEALVTTENLPLGAVRLLNSLRDMRFTDTQLREHIVEIADVELGNYKKLYLKNKEVENLVAIGNSMTQLLLRDRRKKLVDGYMTAEEATGICRTIRKLRPDALEAMFAGGREYARLMLVTALVCERLIERLGAVRIYLPGTCFCDGIAAEYAEKQKLMKLRHNFENDIVAEARNMAKRYRCNTDHAAAVEQCTLKLFDAVKKQSGLSKRDRLLLQIAAILHTCGKFISIKNGPACSFHIINNTEMIGISHEERKMIAAVVLYHSEGFDYEEAAEKIGNPVRIAKLTAIMSLANALDRSHGGKLADVRMKAEEKTAELVIATDYEGDLTLERLALEGRGEFFEELFGLKPVLRQKRRF